MFSKLKALFGGGGSSEPEAPAVMDATEYKGYRIRPAPYKNNGQYQTAGVIEKDFPDGPKEHKFIRAESHPSLDDAAAFAITKGQQIIDQQGDRLFNS